VRILFGLEISDVNTPFRLMRRARLRPLLSGLPDDCFAPNVALAGLAARAGFRIGTVGVIHRGRPSGGGSLGGLRLWRAAGRSWWQTLAIARRARRGCRS
jgi:hypothetical protein